MHKVIRWIVTTWCGVANSQVHWASAHARLGRVEYDISYPYCVSNNNSVTTRDRTFHGYELWHRDSKSAHLSLSLSVAQTPKRRWPALHLGLILRAAFRAAMAAWSWSWPLPELTCKRHGHVQPRGLQDRPTLARRRDSKARRSSNSSNFCPALERVHLPSEWR